MSTYSDLIAKANETSLPYLLIGGHAVGAWGYCRATKDIDFLVPEDSLEGWIAFLSETGYSILHRTHSFAQFAPRKDELPVLDLMIVDKSTFKKLSARSVEKPFAEHKVTVPSIENLIALKCHSIRYGSKKRLIKDWMDILELVDICKIDVLEPGFRAMIIRYGGQNTYDEIIRHISDTKG